MSQIDRVALVLQGGGALGAYQAGVFQALHEHGTEPDWIAGTSIGAINGALLAGSPPAQRLDRVREFWRTVSNTPDYGRGVNLSDEMHGIISYWNAMFTFANGAPGFFSPRWFPNFFFPSSAEAGYWDASPLRHTLLRLVDFNLINSDSVRLSLGAVRVTRSTQRYFDSRREKIGVDHVLASAALPPVFPPVRIDGELYWDGSIYSNTPIEAVLEDAPRKNTLCFVVDLFDPSGPEPKNIPEVMMRQKQITYATRARRELEEFREKHNLRRAVRALYQALPEALREQAQFKALSQLGCETTMHLVHLGYPGERWELVTKDADFSQAALEDRWNQGYKDAKRALRLAPWTRAIHEHTGVVVHSMLTERDGSTPQERPSVPAEQAAASLPHAFSLPPSSAPA